MRYSHLLFKSEEYQRQLSDFIEQYELPEVWFDNGIDHLAVKAYNPEVYRQTVENFRHVSDRITESQIHGRRIAAAKLGEFSVIQSIRAARGKTIGWVEIMEARPEDQSSDPVRFDHAEVYVPRGIIPIHTVLSRRNLNPLSEHNNSHEWVSVIIEPYGGELKFSDRSLAEIVQADLETGRGRLV